MIFYNKRSELEIIYELLSLSEEDIKKTSLMYRANLCYTLFNKYLEFLLDKELLTTRSNNWEGKTFLITDKGRNVLDITATLLREFQ
jgi:predicted transcriptional regulator